MTPSLCIKRSWGLSLQKIHSESEKKDRGGSHLRANTAHGFNRGGEEEGGERLQRRQRRRMTPAESSQCILDCTVIDCNASEGILMLCCLHLRIRSQNSQRNKSLKVSRRGNEPRTPGRSRVGQTVPRHPSRPRIDSRGLKMKPEALLVLMAVSHFRMAK